MRSPFLMPFSLSEQSLGGCPAIATSSRSIVPRSVSVEARGDCIEAASELIEAGAQTTVTAPSTIDAATPSIDTGWESVVCVPITIRLALDPSRSEEDREAQGFNPR